MTYYFKELTIVSGVLKKNLLFLQNLILQIDPLSIAVPKTALPRKKIKAISTPEEQLFGERSCSKSHP